MKSHAAMSLLCMLRMIRLYARFKLFIVPPFRIISYSYHFLFDLRLGAFGLQYLTRIYSAKCIGTDSNAPAL
jgi:hypothetical protein